MTSPGSVIATGRTSTVVEFGDGRVAKILTAGVPDQWAHAEAVFTDEVRRSGAPAPEVIDVVEIDGRPAIVFERIVGPSMWQAMVDDRTGVDDLVVMLVDVQRSIHRIGPCARLPALTDRMATKFSDVDSLDASEVSAACEMLGSLPCGAALLHGDLHPGNILLGDDGPVVIDWFDACIGHPDADVARTALLLAPSGATDLRHLPGVSPALIAQVSDRYRASTTEPDGGWDGLVAVSRLAERTDIDPSGLTATWQAALDAR